MFGHYDGPSQNAVGHFELSLDSLHIQSSPFKGAQWLSGILETKGLQVRASPASLLTVRHINSCLVLVQPRKTCPDITEKLLTGR